MSRAVCMICSEKFYVKPSHQKLGWGKFCSKKCKNLGQLKGKSFNCFVCRKQVYKPLKVIKKSTTGKFFCSKSCHIKWRNSKFIEENHPNWTSGINVYRKILLRSDKIQNCVMCEINDLRVLVAHHVDHNRKNNTISNLIWLCMNCHYLLHNDKQFEISTKQKINE